MHSGRQTGGDAAFKSARREVNEMALQSTVSTSAGRILVVDDDKRARDFIVSSLRADGHEVDASSNSFEALRMLGRSWYDLIVSELRMPELDGPSLYSEVTRRWPSPRFCSSAAMAATASLDSRPVKSPEATVTPGSA